MGVYIKGMSKPKRCIEELDCGLLDNPCLFVDEREACLLQNNSKIGEYEENYSTCPLIEIVTCRECKYAKYRLEGIEYEKCMITQLFVNKSDFCSYGERRADDI